MDWLRFTFLPVGSMAAGLEQVVQYMRLWFSIPINVVPSKRGLHGYSSSHDVQAFLNGQFIRIAIIAHGGANVGNTMCIDLMGTGCGAVTDWQAVYATMQDLDAKITRCDLAVDFLQGEYTYEQIRKMYFDGEFNSGGRIPKYYEHTGGDIHTPNGGGRTFEIGKRVNGKMLRAYEKGKQLKKQDSDWLRIEVEFGSRDRVIPHDIVLRRNEYFAGAHKALAPLLDAAACKIATDQKQHELTLDEREKHLMAQWGPTIHMLMIERNEDAAATVDRIRVRAIPARMQRTALARHVHGSHDPEPLNGSS